MKFKIRFQEMAYYEDVYLKLMRIMKWKESIKATRCSFSLHARGIRAPFLASVFQTCRTQSSFHPPSPPPQRPSHSPPLTFYSALNYPRAESYMTVYIHLKVLAKSLESQAN